MASILVVDDDADSCSVVERYLTRAGHAVTCVPNGRHALTALGATIPDVVILDLMMPEMSGVEFLRVIRGYLRWAKLPVIVMTAYPEGPHVDAVCEMGAKCIFTKAQFQMAELAICVNELASGPGAMDQAV